MSPAPTPSRPPGPGPAGVTLTVLSAEHAGTLARLERRNREQLLVGAPERPEEWFTVEGQRASIALSLAEREAGRSLPLVIRRETPEGPAVVGRISLNGITRGAAQSASLGYWVDREHTGQGIATAAVRLAVAAAFGGLGLHRVQAEVQVGNAASLRVLERCGFARIGLAPGLLRLGGDWADCHLLQLVHADWREPVRTPAPARHLEDGTVLTAEVPAREEAVALYRAVGWTAYTDDPASLERGLAGSTHVVTARRDGELVGLARVVSDGATIAYLQDVLVRPGQQRAGLGRTLVEAALAPVADVRQTVLLTGDDPGQRAFYEALGLTEVHDHPAGLRAFVRLR